MWRPHSSNVSDSEFSFFSAQLKRILRLKEQPPAHCPPELVPTLQLLPWGVRDIFAYVVIEEEADEQTEHSDAALEELRRYARSMTGGQLHPSWQVPTVDELAPLMLRRLCQMILQRQMQPPEDMFDI